MSRPLNWKSSRTAVRLRISQSTLTPRIRALEGEVDVPLFIRMSADLAERMPFDIDVFGSTMFDVVPRVLGEFSKRNPHAELRLHNVRKDQQVTLLHQGKIQIAFDRFLPQESDFAYELA